MILIWKVFLERLSEFCAGGRRFGAVGGRAGGLVWGFHDWVCGSRGTRFGSGVEGCVGGWAGGWIGGRLCACLVKLWADERSEF